MSNNKTMNSNIQILRFIAMLLIVCFHGRTMLGFKELGDQSLWLFTGMRAVTSWGLVGVWIFVAISGFYLVGKPFHIRRVFSILFQVLIYIAALYTTFFFVEANNGSTPDIASKKIYESFIDSVFAPLWAGGYWYITSYLLTLFFLPVINLLFKKCSLATIKKILVITSIAPILYHFNYGGTISGFVTMLWVYTLMGYLRESKFSPKHHWPFVLLAILIPLATLASLVTLRFVPDTEGVNRFYNHLLTKITGSIDRGSIPMILEGVILVMLTLRLKPHSWRPVNYASKFILGIYLLHEGILFRFSRWTFGYFQHTVSFIQPNAWMPLTFLIVGFGLMMFCWLCEVVRYYCFQVPFEMVMNFGDKKFAKIDRYFDLCRGEETEKA